jgi:transcription antitermination factor NusG
MLKLSENPPTIWPAVDSLASLGDRWMVAHTKARCEKALAWDLLRQEVAYFLPMMERISISGGRKRHVVLPLFPSYIFICGNDDDRYTALATNHVCQVIEVADTQRLIRELSAVERVTKCRAELDLYPSLPVGQQCRITAGPFSGLEGTVVRRDATARFVLRVDFIGLGAAMEVDADLLEEA